MEKLTIAQQISRFFAGLSYEGLPEQTRKKVCSSVLDMLECAYNANVGDSRISSSLAVSSSVAGNCRLWGTNLRSDACSAAFFNAARAAVSYRNSLCRKAGVHPVEIVAAAAFAVAEDHDLPLSSAYLGIVCGVEVMTRLGVVLMKGGKPRAVRMSAACGPIGAAVAASVTMGFDESQICSAISLASHFSFGTNQWGSEGTGEDVFHAGFAAREGVFVTSLVSKGAVGAAGALDGEAGLFACFNSTDHCSEMIIDLGKGFAIDDLEFKSVEGCLMTQSPSKAVMNMPSIPDPAEIDSIRIGLSKQAMLQPGCDSMTVENDVQAKMNIRYVVSSLLHGTAPGMIRWLPPYDKSILDFMKRIELYEDSEKTTLFPSRIPGDLDFVMKDGSMLHASVEDFGGLSDEESKDRFVSTFGKERSAELADEIVSAVADANAPMRCLTEKLI